MVMLLDSIYISISSDNSSIIHTEDKFPNTRMKFKPLNISMPQHENSTINVRVHNIQYITLTM